MKARIFLLLILALALITIECKATEPIPLQVIELPPAQTTGSMSLEQAILKRRSLRSYQDRPLALQDLAQLLWAAQGITSPGGLRASPSAGGLYPMTLFVFRATGIHRYDPNRHALLPVQHADRRKKLAAAGLGQQAIARAPAVIVIAADVEVTAVKYRGRSTRYCDLEAGHIAQNIALQATARGIGTVTIGAFEDEAVRNLLGLSEKWRIEYVLPVGYP